MAVHVAYVFTLWSRSLPNGENQPPGIKIDIESEPLDLSFSCLLVQRTPPPLLVEGLSLVYHSKIPWYPKLLFQRETALASF
jgi:hypothetical protein